MTAPIARSVRGHALSVDRLTKRYGGLPAVDAVTLRVTAGTFFSLLGPSGSGKTTMLMLMAGFVEPTEGEVFLDGRVITRVPPERRNFGMVFQGYALFPHQTVAENVAFPLAVRRVPRAEREARVLAALDLVQLTAFRDRFPKQLSGGQQQRVALARALVFEPALLLLDEPLSALDTKLRSTLQWELRALHRRLGMTFVCVTHDQEEALSLSDELAVLRHGRLVQTGTPPELFERPATHFVADFLGASNFITGTVSEREAGTLEYMVGARRFRHRLDRENSGIGEPVLIALRPNKLVLHPVEPRHAINRIPCRISSWTYKGMEIHVLLETPVGRLTLYQPTGLTAYTLEAGKPVWVAWDPDAGVLVQDDRPDGERCQVGG